MKKYILLILISVSTVDISLAQSTLSGTVRNEENATLPGVTVSIKETARGVLTDMEGKYSIEVSPGEVVVFSFIGLETKEHVYNGEQELDVVLNSSIQEIEKVVVTALGIKREEKALGYAQQSVDGDDLMTAVPSNWTSGLKGKIAGAQINSTNSGPIGSEQIVLRGTSSFDLGSNHALVVIDGVPMNAEMTNGAGTSAVGGDDAPVDFGNVISNINPDDIESVSVLKGAGAAALYGSRAANGVLMITTKSGSKPERGSLGITINSSVSFDVIQRWPEWQYRYGHGRGTEFDANGDRTYSYGQTTGNDAWGPEFKGQMFYQYDPYTETQAVEKTPWRAYKDNRKDFWKTGVTTRNVVTIRGGNSKNNIRASAGYSSNSWIMPNTGNDNTWVSAKTNSKINDCISVSVYANYSTRNSDNLPTVGYNNGTISYFMMHMQPGYSLDWFKPIWKKGQEKVKQIRLGGGNVENPYLIVYEQTNSLRSNQFVGSASANIELMDGLNLMVRSSVNTYSQHREQKRPYDSYKYQSGYYSVQEISNHEMNHDFLLTYKDVKKSDFNYTVSFGGNMMSVDRYNVRNYVRDLIVPDIYRFSNAKSAPNVALADRKERVNSLYGMANFGYKDVAFLDITGRNDWSSTLPSHNWSFFYPSVNASVILSDIFDIRSKNLNYLKYRLSFAQVGNDTSPYQTSKYYDVSEFGGSATVPTTLYNRNLEPEITTSWETGFELRVLRSRLVLDATLYQADTKNQIISMDIENSSGFNAMYINAGNIRNRGVELSLTGKIIDNSKLTWRSTVNWSLNRGIVTELPDEVDNQFTVDKVSPAYIIAKEGSSPTALYGLGFQRAPDGQILYQDGLPVSASSDAVQYMGEITPDWRMGWVNNITVGRVKVSFTFDGQLGGVLYSKTYSRMMTQGHLQDSYAGREFGSILGKGVVDNGDGTYSPNDVRVPIQNWYSQYYNDPNVESSIFDASYIKLREARVQYSFPTQWFKGSFVQGLSMSVYGSNLFTISDFPIYDIDAATLNGTKITPGIEMGQMPSPTTYGFNIKLDL